MRKLLATVAVLTALTVPAWADHVAGPQREQCIRIMVRLGLFDAATVNAAYDGSVEVRAACAQLWLACYADPNNPACKD